MFWLLIVLLFHVDGTKSATVLIEPSGSTVDRCIADANALAVAFHDHPDPDIMGVGFKCDGPLDDPTVKKLKASAAP